MPAGLMFTMFTLVQPVSMLEHWLIHTKNKQQLRLMTMSLFLCIWGDILGCGGWQKNPWLNISMSYYNIHILINSIILYSRNPLQKCNWNDNGHYSSKKAENINNRLHFLLICPGFFSFIKTHFLSDRKWWLHTLDFENAKTFWCLRWVHLIILMQWATLSPGDEWERVRERIRFNCIRARGWWD